MRRLPLLALLLGALLVPGAAPAAADVAVSEVHQRPADGVFRLQGHGFGHGRGMSQWGAQGAATLGRTADEITSFYYPGTGRAVLAPSVVRVQLSADEGRDLVVQAGPGMVVTDVSTGIAAPLPAGASRYRVVVDAAGLHAQALTGSTWEPVPIGGGTAHGGPLRLSGPALSRVHLPDGTSREYRGVVQGVRTGTTTMASVVVLDLEDYLLGVVPREAPASWRPAALQAQAIAARSYTVFKRDRVAPGAGWDICDTTACQVFGGTRAYSASGAVTEVEHPNTTAAVRATAGVVRTWQGKAVFAEFSSSNGGWTVRGDVPYLVAQRDDWDGVVANSVHSWSATIRAADLEKRFPAVGTLRRLRVVTRDGNGEWGGRARTVVLEGVSSTGAATRVQTTGEAVRLTRSWPTASDGLKSAWWKVVSPPETPRGARRGLVKGTGPSLVAR